MATKTPDEYREEMMRLYRRAQAAQPAVPPSPPPISVQSQPAAPSPAQPDTVPPVSPQASIPKQEPAPEPETPPSPAPEIRQPERTEQSRVPEPETPFRPQPEPEPPAQRKVPPENESAFPFSVHLPDTELQSDFPPAAASVPTPEETSYGWLKVTTRTADDALPLEGVSVLVLREDGKETQLLYSMLTDQSGETPRIQLPAPPINGERMQPYSTYTIRAFLPGYSRMESQAVPIFSGITTLQPFAMLPLPVGAGDDQPTIIYQNTEPKF